MITLFIHRDYVRIVVLFLSGRYMFVEENEVQVCILW